MMTSKVMTKSENTEKSSLSGKSSCPRQIPICWLKYNGKKPAVARIKEYGQAKLRNYSLLYILARKAYNFLRRLKHYVLRKYDHYVFKLGLFKAKYEAWYEDDIDFSEFKTDIKAIAFYLPQFHQIPENDEWWGKGFTEWTNTRKADPLFKGHYQPREPHPDIGHYDLTDISVIRKQAELARRHGIHGFCFYHYWFAGKRLLEKPIDMLLEHPEVDIPFCLCWANENWTRKWDGGDNTILIKQDYSKSDSQEFIEDFTRYLCDKRYIAVEGKPLMIIYRISHMPDPKMYISTWREHCRESGIGEIAVYAVYHGELGNDTKAEELGVDGFVEFPPHRVTTLPVNYEKTNVYDYEVIAKNYGLVDGRPEKCIKTVMLGWDNTARKGNNDALVFNKFNIYEYFKWLKRVIAYTRDNFHAKDRFVFINAWNEWAEGTYLEPDKTYGYNYLNITSRAIFDLPYNYNNENYLLVETDSDSAIVTTQSSVAVHLHVHSIDGINEIAEYLGNIPFQFDLFVSTCDADSKQFILERLSLVLASTTQMHIQIVPDIGRDIAPWLIDFSHINREYDYVCHVHTDNEGFIRQTGLSWRDHIFQNLLGSPSVVSDIIRHLDENPQIGLLAPVAPQVVAFEDYAVRQNLRAESLRHEKRFLKKMKIDIVPKIEDPILFGAMFWYRPKALKPLFQLGLDYDAFSSKPSALNGSTTRAFERIPLYAAMHAGYESKFLYNKLAEGRTGREDVLTDSGALSRYSKNYNYLKNIIRSNTLESHTLINGFIADNCDVLEFGPSTGHFTRYLSEERKAAVDIVEIDEASAAVAKQFSRNCVVGDIEEYGWKDALSCNKYDFILFPDVLEHLRDPWKVLKQAKQLLKCDGRVIISIPNIAHNSVIIGLCRDDFSYCNVGILDKTHVRFFTEKTAKRLVEDSGLEIEAIKYSVQDDLSNLGIGYGLEDVPLWARLFFKKRKNSNVVQFVMSCKIKHELLNQKSQGSD